MSKILRETMKIFGSTAGADEIEQFGSLAEGSPVYTTDIAVIQSLSNYLEGWFGGVVGANLPAIEDMNAIAYLYAYQLAYIFQAGVPEWDAGTTYYTNSIINSGGVLFVSLQDNNINHAVTDPAWWGGLQQQSSQTFSASGNFTAPVGCTSVKVRGLQSGVRPVATAGCIAFTIATDGNTYGWGSGVNQGNIGNGVQQDYSSPVVLLNSLGFQKMYSIVAASESVSSNWAINQAGDLFGWGYNVNGQLGVGDVAPRSSPTMVVGGINWSALFLLDEYPGQPNWVLGLDLQGNCYGWGINDSGQLGTGNVTTFSSPVAVVGGLQFSTLAVISEGSSFTGAVIGITKAGVAYAWGSNTSGELGVGDVTPRSSPIAVLGGHTFAKVIGTTGDTFLAIDINGAMWGWGSNSQGTIGCGDNTPRSSPVAVLGGLTFQKVIASGNAIYGLTTAGVLYSWGNNTNGQLGLGDVLARSSPVAVLGGLTVSDIFASSGAQVGSGIAVFALTSAGALYGWGQNVGGACGVGDIIPHSSPVAVLGGLTFTKMFLSNNENAMFALTKAGQLYSWGFNSHGQLGLGDVAPRSSPVAVLTNRIPNTVNPEYVKEFTVVPGSVYPVQVGTPMGTFNGVAVGPALTQMIVEFTA